MTVEPAAEGNVDPGEVARFSQLAARWWDADGELRPLHLMNPLRLDYIERQVGGFAGRRVLDVGCGGGLLAEGMAARGARVTGIDAAASALTVARLHAHESGVEVDYRETTAERLADDEPTRFDIVTCLEMLEHVPDPSAVVAACSRVLDAGGIAVFSTINRNPRAYLLAILAGEYLLRMLPPGTHDYARFIRPSELDRWARDRGLVLRDVSGMRYLPWASSFEITADVGVNYLATFANERGDDAG